MNWRWRPLVVTFLLPWVAKAHVGSPDVFSDGLVGPYPARITIRMPSVVPGRAEISVRVQSDRPVEVSFLPLYSRTPVTNAPPADPGFPVFGETNLYSGELWLMSFGAYSVEVRIKGQAGEGIVEIPVNSVALKQLPLPRHLAEILLVLGAILILGGLGILKAAAGESVLAPGVEPGNAERRKAWKAVTVTAVIFALLLIGGKRWWDKEETVFRRHLREGAWPDLATEVRREGSQRILRLTLGKKDFGPDYFIPLLPDHGKLLHLFLIREPARDAMAHLHPVRTGGKTFEVALPPLPEGRYKVLCDLTIEGSGVSSTATNSVDVPAVPDAPSAPIVLQSDPDDSWSFYSASAVSGSAASNSIYLLPEGEQVIWKPHSPLRVNHDASLRFEVQDATGHPVGLEPYMGMMSHAAVLKSDGTVFDHLHPSGNFSMAARSFFEAKKQSESPAGLVDAAMPAGMDHSKMGHSMHYMASPVGVSTVYLPYEFPSPGEYRIWVQFKIAGKVMTSVFDTSVEQ